MKNTRASPETIVTRGRVKEQFMSEYCRTTLD